MIKVIYFDFFNVLCTTTYPPIIKKFAPIDKQKYLLSKIDFLDLGQITEDNLIAEISEISKVNKDIIECEVARIPVFNKKLEEFIIDSLKPNYKIGLLTNANKTMIDRLLEKPEIFDLIVISSEVKMVKPNKNIFDFAINRSNVKPNEILFIDDSKVNIDAANAMNINTIRYTNYADFIEQINKII